MSNEDTRSEAERALDDHLRFICHDMDRWIDLFTDDAVVEFPYAASLGREGRFVGKPAIDAYFRGTPGLFRELRFRDLRRHAGADPHMVCAEVHGSALIGPAGAPYEQDYVMILRTRDGKISHYREYWNPLPVIAAFPEVTP